MLEVLGMNDDEISWNACRFVCCVCLYVTVAGCFVSCADDFAFAAAYGSALFSFLDPSLQFDTLYHRIQPATSHQWQIRGE